MYEGNIATLQMQDMLFEQGQFDETVYRCRILKYEKNTEDIYLVLESASLQNILRDAVYECRIVDQMEPVACKGIIRGRCVNEHGDMLHFRIEAGFYEINIK